MTCPKVIEPVPELAPQCFESPHSESMAVSVQTKRHLGWSSKSRAQDKPRTKVVRSRLCFPPKKHKENKSMVTTHTRSYSVQSFTKQRETRNSTMRSTAGTRNMAVSNHHVPNAEVLAVKKAHKHYNYNVLPTTQGAKHGRSQVANVAISHTHATLSTQTLPQAIPPPPPPPPPPPRPPPPYSAEPQAQVPPAPPPPRPVLSTPP